MCIACSTVGYKQAILECKNKVLRKAMACCGQWLSVTSSYGMILSVNLRLQGSLICSVLDALNAPITALSEICAQPLIRFQV